jgi:hypothetical protein
MHQMGIQLNETKDKNTMAGLYDSYLQNNQNKLKIFNILRKDTQMRNSRLGLTQRESVPPSNNMSNVSKNKHMNISNEVRPFEQGNRRVQEINISQKIYTNKPEYTPNTFVSNNMNHEQDNETVDYRYPNNVNQKSVEQSFSNSRNFQNPNILNVSHRPEFNNYQNLDNSKNNYNNTSNNANYPSFNNENSIRVRENNNSINEKIYTNKGTPFYNQPQELNSSNLRNSNSNQFRNNNYNNNNNNYNNNNNNNQYNQNRAQRAALWDQHELQRRERGGNSSGLISSDGYFKGRKIYGKVMVVDRFPDFKVQVVDSFPDLKVKKVSSFPERIGEWQFVDSFPDFTIQYVNSFPDIKIKFVSSFPGIP